LRFPDAVLDDDQLLMAVRRGPQQHQDALPAAFQADVAIDAIGPDVDIVLVRQRALAPIVVLPLPDALKPRNGRGGQAWRLGAEDGGQGFAEVASAHALEVQPRDQLLQALGLAQIRRLVVLGQTVLPVLRSVGAYAVALCVERTASGRDGSRRQGAVPADPAYAAVVAAVLGHRDPLPDFGLNCLGE